MTDDDVIMTCYISLGGARLHKSEFTLGRGNMGGLYKGVMGFDFDTHLQGFKEILELRV